MPVGPSSRLSSDASISASSTASFGLRGRLRRAAAEAPSAASRTSETGARSAAGEADRRRAVGAVRVAASRGARAATWIRGDEAASAAERVAARGASVDCGGASLVRTGAATGCSLDELRRRVDELRVALGLLQAAALRALEALRRLGVAGLHAKHATPRVGGLASVGELLFPDARDLARELGARVHVLAAEDLVLVELHERLVVVELHEEPGELVHHALILGREVVELLQVGGRVDRLDELIAADLRAAREELLHERAVEDLAERVAQRGLGAARIAAVDAERLEHVERERVDVRDERIAEPRERLLDVVEIAMRDHRGAAKQVRARASAVACAVSAGGERLAERAAEAIAAAELVAVACGRLEGAERVVGRARR